MFLEKFKDNATFVLRLFLGIGFLVAGLDKLFHLEMATGMFEKLLGIGALVWVALIVEILGGIFLLVGYQTRWTASILGVLILVAFFSTFGVSGGDFIMTLREIFVMNGEANVPVNVMYFAGLLSLAMSGSDHLAVKPE